MLKKIILVEDDEFDAELTRKELQNIPVANEIIWLETGGELIDYLDEYGADDIAVAILDLQMPILTGIEALQTIKEKAYEHFPIVVLSSSKEHPDIKKCYELGINSFVTKPVKTAEFQEAVRTLGLYWGILNVPPE
ncbi:MAG: response regulator [Bacteroidota bacterium]